MADERHLVPRELSADEQDVAIGKIRELLQGGEHDPSEYTISYERLDIFTAKHQEESRFFRAYPDGKTIYVEEGFN